MTPPAPRSGGGRTSTGTGGDGPTGTPGVGGADNAGGSSTRDRPPGRGRLSLAGWFLYVASWITPSLDVRQVGATAFVESARFGWNLLSTDHILPGLGVIAGWLANFSLLLRLPAWARVLSSVAPWLAFTVVLLKLPVRPSLPERAAFFLYFYPWAVGIALIHAANICAARNAVATDAVR